jgi:hypothetical protein
LSFSVIDAALPQRAASASTDHLQSFPSRHFEVVPDLAFQAADCEDVAPGHVVGDAGDERLETLCVVSTARLRRRPKAPLLFLLGTDRAAEQLEAPARLVEISGNGPLHGTSQCEQVDLSQCANCIRVHWQQL